MQKQVDQEMVKVTRRLIFFRLLMLLPFLIIAIDTSSVPASAAATFLLLAVLGTLPGLFSYFHERLLLQRVTQVGITLFDLLMVSLVNILAVTNSDTPYFFPLFLIISVEAAFWWGWAGALFCGATGGLVLSLLYLTAPGTAPYLWLALLVVTLGWPLVLGVFVQWALHQWQQGRRFADELTRQGDALRREQSRFRHWQETCLALDEAPTYQALLATALECAVVGTGSSVGLVALRAPDGEGFHVECAYGFDLPSLGRDTLRPADEVSMLGGGDLMKVRHVLEASLRAAPAASNNGHSLVGRIVVAQDQEWTYQEGDERWMRLLTGYTGVLLENRFLAGQLGRLRHEADGIVLAGSTLASLPNPAAAMEMACRNILHALALERVVIVLYGEAEQKGCHIIAYPADGPTCTVTASLQGRGPRLLQGFLRSGAPLIVNRRGECPEIFEAMSWDGDVQAAACFPLSTQRRRWGALCLLAESPGAFPPQTQQNLAIFNGEVAMALENFYLRRALAGVNDRPRQKKVALNI
jgi:GAF domain-containing protein